MADTSLLLNPFCAPDVLEDLEGSFVREIAPDVWFIEGYLGIDFFQKPPSSRQLNRENAENWKTGVGGMAYAMIAAVG